MNTGKLLALLDGVIRLGDDRYIARCPAHDDRSPSLSIKDAGDRILIYCHAGCLSDSVLEAIGLTWLDLYPDKWEAAYATATSGRASRGHATKVERNHDPLDIERMILASVAADIRAGKTLSIEDRARVELARLRLSVLGEDSA